MTHKPGNLSCAEVRDCLSDVIDARRGEIPHPDGTRLAEPGLYPAIELHLAACATCREELNTLEELGFAFADFSVNELPAQQFENFGQKARERMALQARAARNANVTVRPRSFWLKTAASLAAAACLALVVAPQLQKLNKKDQGKLSPHLAKALQLHKDQLKNPVNLQFLRPDGSMLVSQEMLHDPRQPQALEKMRQDEGRYGYLIVCEKLPLLGASLKTTRDVDRVVDESNRVADESIGGLMVFSVLPGSLAERMGLRKNDRIVSLNGLEVKTGGAEEAASFFAGILSLGPGATLNLHVVRPVGTEFLYMKPMEGVLGE